MGVYLKSPEIEGISFNYLNNRKTSLMEELYVYDLNRYPSIITPINDYWKLVSVVCNLFAERYGKAPFIEHVAWNGNSAWVYVTSGPRSYKALRFELHSKDVVFIEGVREDFHKNLYKDFKFAMVDEVTFEDCGPIPNASIYQEDDGSFVFYVKILLPNKLRKEETSKFLEKYQKYIGPMKTDDRGFGAIDKIHEIKTSGAGFIELGGAEFAYTIREGALLGKFIEKECGDYSYSSIDDDDDFSSVSGYFNRIRSSYKHIKNLFKNTKMCLMFSVEEHIFYDIVPFVSVVFFTDTFEESSNIADVILSEIHGKGFPSTEAIRIIPQSTLSGIAHNGYLVELVLEPEEGSSEDYKYLKKKFVELNPTLRSFEPRLNYSRLEEKLSGFVGKVIKFLS